MLGLYIVHIIKKYISAEFAIKLSPSEEYDINIVSQYRNITCLGSDRIIKNNTEERGQCIEYINKQYCKHIVCSM